MSKNNIFGEISITVMVSFFSHHFGNIYQNPMQLMVFSPDQFRKGQHNVPGEISNRSQRTIYNVVSLGSKILVYRLILIKHTFMIPCNMEQFIWRHGWHSGWASTAALRVAGSIPARDKHLYGNKHNHPDQFVRVNGLCVPQHRNYF